MSKELPKELVILTRTHQLLAEAKTFEDFKAIRSKAQAARLYARSVQLGLQVQIHAAELTLECERRAGRVISEIVLSHGGRPGKNAPREVTTRLKDLGINKSQSSRWQSVARLSENLFQKYLAECRSAGREPTSKGLLDQAKRFTTYGVNRNRSSRAPTRSKSESTTIISRNTNTAAEFRSVDEEVAIIEDLRSHHQQLSETLLDFCGDGPPRTPTNIQRRYVKHLLKEMEKELTELAELKNA